MISVKGAKLSENSIMLQDLADKDHSAKCSLVYNVLEFEIIFSRVNILSWVKFDGKDKSEVKFRF